MDDLGLEAPERPRRPRIALRVVLVLLALFVAWFVPAGWLLESTNPRGPTSSWCRRVTCWATV